MKSRTIKIPEFGIKVKFWMDPDNENRLLYEYEHPEIQPDSFFYHLAVNGKNYTKGHFNINKLINYINPNIKTVSYKATDIKLLSQIMKKYQTQKLDNLEAYDDLVITYISKHIETYIYSQNLFYEKRRIYINNYKKKGLLKNIVINVDDFILISTGTILVASKIDKKARLVMLNYMNGRPAYIGDLARRFIWADSSNGSSWSSSRLLAHIAEGHQTSQYKIVRNLTKDLSAEQLENLKEMIKSKDKEIKKLGKFLLKNGNTTKKTGNQ